jgi:predicted HTH transcriptional regulator
MSRTTFAPFNQEALNRIFTISSIHPDRLTSRESSWLEFKESWGFGSLGKYKRSAAGVANAKGGYIIYGIGNSPHTLIGLKNDSFDKLDPEKLTQFLNEHFDPEIHCDRLLYELNEKTYGLLYIHESVNKPVVC